MATVEMESEDFIKALRLLHSRAPESSDELGRLLDIYYIKQQNMDSKKPKDLLHAFSALDSLSHSIREAEKKAKITEDDSETDVEDNDYSTCNVCKQMDVSSSNQLVDCQECRLKYHQECHKPTITKKEADPRSIWYCSKCSKKAKQTGSSKLVASKMTTSISAFQSVNYPNISATNKGPNSAKLDTDSKLASQSSSAFKRVQGKYAPYPPVSTAKSPMATSAPRSISAAAKNKTATSSSAFASTNNYNEKRMGAIKKTKTNSKHLH